MARRQKRSEHINLDRWLISYADFVTLLFAFFVVMYSISSVNESKYKVFSEALNVAFSNRPTSSALLNQAKSQAANSSLVTGSPDQPATSHPKTAPSEDEQLLKELVDKRTARLGDQQRKLQERMNNLGNNLKRVMSPLLVEHLVNINVTKRGVVIDINAGALFKAGEAVLQPGSLEVLRQVAVVLRKEELPIEVEGHTDDMPISTVQFPSNWELSSARASSVARMLISNGVSDKRLAVLGLAANHPLVPNDSPENRARNRRVNITILAPSME